MPTGILIYPQDRKLPEGCHLVKKINIFVLLCHRGWPIGKTMCILAVTLRWMFSFTGYLQLALIAFSRFILLRSPREVVHLGDVQA